MNAQFTSGFKKYQNEFPSELLNCAVNVVEDILNKMKQVLPAMIKSVKSMPTVLQTFSARGESIHHVLQKGSSQPFPKN